MADSHPTDSFPDFQEGRHAFIQMDMLDEVLNTMRNAMNILENAHEETLARHRDRLENRRKNASATPEPPLPLASEFEEVTAFPPVGVILSPDGTTRYMLPDGTPLYLSPIRLYLEPNGIPEDCWILTPAPPVSRQTIAVCAKKMLDHLRVCQ